MRGLGTPQLHRTWSYFDSLVILSNYELTGRFGLIKTKVENLFGNPIAFMYLFKEF
jgi:hypothetical protein